MNRWTTRVGSIAAAFATAATLGLGNASAATKISWVGPTPPGEGGQAYLTTSTINNAPLEASSRIYTAFGNTVASGYMGVQARLFKSGVLCQITDYVYNVGPTNQMITNTYGHCGTGSYNSHGFVKYWTGDGYGDFLTFPTDPLNYSAPAARSAGTVAPVKSGKNSRGQTLGSAENARTDSELPDLVAAFSTTGQQGYVRKSDIVGQDPRSPQSAATRGRPASKEVPVFAEDGIRPIGVLRVG